MADENENCPACADNTGSVYGPMANNPNVVVQPYVPPTDAELAFSRNFYANLNARTGHDPAYPAPAAGMPTHAPAHEPMLTPDRMRRLNAGEAVLMSDISGIPVDPNGPAATSARARLIESRIAPRGFLIDSNLLPPWGTGGLLDTHLSSVVVSKTSLAASLRLMAEGFKLDFAGVLSPSDFRRLDEVINTTLADIEFDEREIGPGDPVLRFFWELFYGMWYKAIRSLRRITEGLRAGWNKPFDHSWTCAEKCQYWKEKADHIVNRKHGGSSGKLGTNVRDHQDCVDCCNDYRDCGDLVRGSSDFFTWLLGVP